MAITPGGQSSAPRELVPEGNHVARLYRIIAIGTIPTPYLDENTGKPKEQSKVRLYFELPNEMREFDYDGEKKTLPMSISREVTLSLYKGAAQTAVLRTIAHALIGQAITDDEAETFDIEQLLGMACMVEVEHQRMDNGIEFAKAVGFGSIPKGMTVPEQVNENQVQNVREMTKEEIEELPEWLRDKMKSSREYHVRFEAPREETKPGEEDEVGPDGIPF